jgi:hypothetical protein
MTEPAPQQQPGPGAPPGWWPEDDYYAEGPGLLRRWLAADPAGHGVIAGTPAVWGAGWVLHEIGMTPGWGGAVTTVAAAAAALTATLIGARKVPDWADPPVTIGPLGAALGTAAVGGWLTAAARYGPGWPLTAVLLGGVIAGWYGWLRRHDAVQAARARRSDARTWEERKAFWDDLTARVEDLDGCDLIDHITTLTGEQVCLDTRGTGRLATSIRTRQVEERIGELWHPRIPRGRIDCWLDDLPGRLWISVRTQDPWRYPVIHPAVDGRSVAAKYLERAATCRRPLVIGLDPEDGEPFGLTHSRAHPGLPVWVPDQGGQVILIVGTKGAGKTVAINDVTERLTACLDARVLQINLTAPAEMRAWSAACPANALGRHELGRARAILAWTERYIDDWGETAGEAIATPTEARPHLAVIIDEIANVAEDSVCKARLLAIARLCRKAGVTLIIAGQRATARWLGGADIRAMIDLVLCGRFARRDEVDKAVGVHLELPDIGAYGKGAHGVFMLVELAGGDYDRGRTLKLKEPKDCARIARTRMHLADWTPPEMAEDQAWLWSVITGDADVPLDAWEGPPAEGGDDEDHQVRALDVDPAGQVRAPAVGGVPDVDGVPGEAMRVIWPMLNRREGVTAGQAARRLGKSRATAGRYLASIGKAGRGVVRGTGGGRAWHAADRAPLSVVPAYAPAPAGDDDDQDDDDTGDDDE